MLIDRWEWRRALVESGLWCGRSANHIYAAAFEPTKSLTMDEDQLARIREDVEAIIQKRHASMAWLSSPNRDPRVMRAAFTTAPIRTKIQWRYDYDTESSVPVHVPLEYPYTADEMRAEISRKLQKAETTDPYAHPDYKAARFSAAELLEHVVPHLPKCQPM